MEKENERGDCEAMTRRDFDDAIRLILREYEMQIGALYREVADLRAEMSRMKHVN